MLGNLISAGASIVGGLFGQNTQNQMAKRNLAFQREMAETGVQKRVADAKAAGIHPAAALGAQIASPAPVSVGDSLGPALHNAGQDISRAVNAGADANTRSTAAFNTAYQALQLENMGLQNEQLRTSIARANAPGTPPPIPSLSTAHLIPGQGDTTVVPGITPSITDGPLARTGVDPANPSQEVGSIPGVGFERTPPGWMGGYYPVYGKDVQERMEDDHIGSLIWNFRHRFMPFFRGNFSPPYRAPNGQWWDFNPIRGYFLQGEPLADDRLYRHR